MRVKNNSDDSVKLKANIIDIDENGKITIHFNKDMIPPKLLNVI